jgi:hypothetical protein
MSKYPILKCANCKRYNKEENRQRNKLFCTFKCDEYIQEMSRMAFEYNRAVSDGNFDTKKQYEHGKEVFGSGWKNDT